MPCYPFHPAIEMHSLATHSHRGAPVQRAPICRGALAGVPTNSKTAKVLEFILALDFSFDGSAMTFGAIGAAATHTVTRCVACHDVVSSDMHAYLLLGIFDCTKRCGSAVLNFSDPLRDPSFRSKAVVAGSLMVATVSKMGVTISDSWLYFEQWEHKGAQIILQVCLLYA